MNFTDVLKRTNEICSKLLKKQIEISKKSETKLKRRANKIKNKRSTKALAAKEVNTYESNVTLDLHLGSATNTTISRNNLKTISSFKQEQFKFPAKKVADSPSALTYFDLETGGFAYTADILQVAFKCGEKTYKSYITPTQKIDERASAVTGLTCKGQQLYAQNKLVTSFSKRVVAGEILQFLLSLKKQCILVGHNIKKFDIPRLTLLMYQTGLLTEFYELVDGFTDSYVLLGEKFPEKINVAGQLKLTTLVKEIEIPYENAHDAFADVCAVENLLNFYYTSDYFITKKFDLKDSFLNCKLI